MNVALMLGQLPLLTVSRRWVSNKTGLQFGETRRSKQVATKYPLLLVSGLGHTHTHMLRWLTRTNLASSGLTGQTDTS